MSVRSKESGQGTCWGVHGEKGRNKGAKPMQVCSCDRTAYCYVAAVMTPL